MNQTSRIERLEKLLKPTELFHLQVKHLDSQELIYDGNGKIVKILKGVSIKDLI